MAVYIIEHLEPELYPWCIMEYKSISNLVGKNNLWFTNIKKKDMNKLKKYGVVFNQSVKKLFNSQDNKLTHLENREIIVNTIAGRMEGLAFFCILDPEAKKELKPNEKFDFFIFGGILGDNPPRKRTSPELSRFFPEWEKRNIGKKQFSTDNAVFVTNQIEKGKKFSDLKFQEGLEIKTGRYDSVELPYLYPLINNKPRISKELVSYIKKHPNF